MAVAKPFDLKISSIKGLTDEGCVVWGKPRNDYV